MRKPMGVLTATVLLASALPLYADSTVRAYYDYHNGAMLKVADDHKVIRKANSMRRASNIIGAKVTNRKDETLGEVKELVMNLDDSAIAYVVISAGGVLGVGERWHAVPMNALKMNADKDGFVMNMDKQAWQEAPGFDKDRWPEFGSAEWNMNDKFYR